VSLKNKAEGLAATKRISEMGAPEFERPKFRSAATALACPFRMTLRASKSRDPNRVITLS
jgi:hypothetical protein